MILIKEAVSLLLDMKHGTQGLHDMQCYLYIIKRNVLKS